MPTAPVSHAKLSPSSAHRWLRCTGSLLAESLVPNESSSYADEGSAAHELAAMTLNSEHKAAESFLGRVIVLKDDDGVPDHNRSFEVTEEMCGYVQEYVDAVLDYARGGKIMVETRVDFSDIIGIPGSYGTADCIILSNDGKELHVHDLKYGRGVHVDAKDNDQLMLYALGACEMFDFVGDIERITLGIHMPRKSGTNDWTVTKAEVYDFAEKVKEKAAEAVGLLRDGLAADDVRDFLLPDETLTPGTKQCQWCNFKAQCPALGNEVISFVTNGESQLPEGETDTPKVRVQIEGAIEDLPHDITDVSRLAECLKLTDLVDMWVKAVREAALTRLESGESVPGFKLVRGRKGPRKWESEKTAEELLKSMRLKQHEMYNFKIISPTDAEKLLKDTPKRWKRLNKPGIITQSDGSLSVAPESDPRPAVVIETASDSELAASGDADLDGLV